MAHIHVSNYFWGICCIFFNVCIGWFSPTFSRIRNRPRIHWRLTQLREAPPKLNLCSFGHCPNSHWTPPPALKRALCGTYFGQNHANARLYMDISPKNRCHKPSWQGFRPPKRAMPKWTEIFFRWGFPKDTNVFLCILSNQHFMTHMPMQ